MSKQTISRCDACGAVIDDGFTGRFNTDLVFSEKGKPARIQIEVIPVMPGLMIDPQVCRGCALRALREVLTHEGVLYQGTRTSSFYGVHTSGGTKGPLEELRVDE